MIYLTLGINNHIIDIDINDLLDEVIKDQLHFPLKGSPYIDHTKRHVFIGKGAPMIGKSGFELIIFLQAYIVPMR